MYPCLAARPGETLVLKELDASDQYCVKITRNELPRIGERLSDDLTLHLGVKMVDGEVKGWAWCAIEPASRPLLIELLERCDYEEDKWYGLEVVQCPITNTADLI